METDKDKPEPEKSKESGSKPIPFEKLIEECNDNDFIITSLKELDKRCTEIAKTQTGNDADYAIKLIRKICAEMAVMKLKIVPDRSSPGCYTYDGQLLRNVASIVFKMELLAAKYFAESYKRYTYISSSSHCTTKDKVYELADEWLSDIRTMIDVVSGMLDEIQSLGITPNSVALDESGTGDSLIDILGGPIPKK